MNDSFCIIKKDEIPTFHDTLNSMDPHISFTIEQENNGQIPFLDTLISCNNGTISINIYRKPTHTDRHIDFNSHHDKKHKVSTAATLLRRALNLPNTSEGTNREIGKVYSALQSNGYPSKLIYDVQTKKTQSSTVPSPEELVEMFFKLVDPTMSRNSFASLPYIKGVTEPLTHVLKKREITVVNKPLKTLQQEFPIPKSRLPLTLQPDIV